MVGLFLFYAASLSDFYKTQAYQVAIL
jgi:hypothetical protein